jgi:hypothetical protein
MHRHIQDDRGNPSANEDRATDPGSRCMPQPSLHLSNGVDPAFCRMERGGDRDYAADNGQ